MTLIGHLLHVASAAPKLAPKFVKHLGADRFSHAGVTNIVVHFRQGDAGGLAANRRAIREVPTLLGMLKGLPGASFW